MKLISLAFLVLYIFSTDSREVPNKPDKSGLTNTEETLELNGESLFHPDGPQDLDSSKFLQEIMEEGGMENERKNQVGVVKSSYEPAALDNSCESVGGKCMSKKKAKKNCEGKIDETFECFNKKEVCCIEDDTCLEKEICGSLNKIYSSVKNIDYTVNNIEGIVINIDDTVNNIDSSVMNIDSSVNNMNASVSNIDVSMKNIDGTVNTINGTLDNIHDTVNMIDASVNNVYVSVNNIDGTVNDIDGTVNNIDSSVKNIDHSVNNIDGTVNDIDGTVKIIDGNVNNIDGTVNNIDGTVNIIDASVKNIDDRVNDIDGTVNIIDASVKNIDGTVNNINGTVNNFDASVKNIDGTMMEIYDLLKNMDCPVSEGYFKMPHPSNQCYKFINTPASSWDDASSTCSRLGLQLARPTETIGLRNYLVLNYAGADTQGTGAVQVWLDAKSDGSCVKWNRGPYECISPDIPLWWPNQPQVALGNCLTLTSSINNWKDQPDKTFLAQSCGLSGRYPLCEYESRNSYKECPGVNGLFLWNNGNCYHFSSDASKEQTANWSQAREYCKAIGTTVGKIADLAELGNPNNCGSDQWLMETITAKGKVSYLGAHDPYRNGNWFWVHSGRRLSLENPLFGPTEPNRAGQGVENCLVTWKFGDRNPQRQYIGDYNCNIVEHYVCQLFN